MQWLLGQNIGEKVLNLKLQTLFLDLECQVCGVVPAPDVTIYLVDINGTHYWGSI